MGQEPISDYNRRERILAMVRTERLNQIDKFGRQRLEDGTGRTGDTELRDMRIALTDLHFDKGNMTWMDVLGEEVAELKAETDKKKLLHELIQSIAVGVSWAEHLLEQQEEGEW